jgi:Aminopeptidase N
MENLPTAQSSQTLQSTTYRLPPNVRPKKYSLTLKTDIPEESFSGRVVIDIEVAIPTNEIILNAVDLDISEAKISLEQGDFLQGTVEPIRETERACITFPSTLDKGLYRLDIGFSGRLSSKLRGFYRSKVCPGGN